MIIAFLDLLGFSHLIESNIVAAYDNLNSFNRVIQTKITDNKTHPVESYEESMREFVENTAITSFDNMISISDSLIISSRQPSLFVKQLSNLVSAIYIRYSEPFRQPFDDVSVVKSNKLFTMYSTNNIQPHNSFPIMFRGGISYGEDVIFNRETQIFSGEISNNGINVCGLSYVRAVQLEKSGKGPRLFCDKNFVKQLDKESTRAIRKIDENIYELVWTYYACETDENCSDKQCNISKRINSMLLPSAYNLYSYYDKTECADENGYKKTTEHYKEFVFLVYRGIMKYAKDNGINLEQTHTAMLKRINDENINNHLKINDLESFI